MIKKLILIKLGGSLISDKTKVNKARNDEIKKLSKQIKEISRNYSVILFTGAGGFGHPVAEKYKRDLKEGLIPIRNACKKLNKIVVETLINQGGLKAVSVSPSDAVTYRNGKLLAPRSSKNEVGLLSDIVTWLEKDIIPVFHADLVDDQALGISILSMDKFLVDLAIFLKNKGYFIEKAIFAGSTPVLSTYGVDKGPLEQDKTIKQITKKDFPKIQDVFYKGKGIDVSGGMRYKVEQCLRLADERIDSFITSDLSLRGTKVTI